MGYFQVRYNPRVINYDRRGFIRLATGYITESNNKKYFGCHFGIFKFISVDLAKSFDVGLVATFCWHWIHNIVLA